MPLLSHFLLAEKAVSFHGMIFFFTIENKIALKGINVFESSQLLVICLNRV